MTSDGTETLILTFTSKTGHSVGLNRHSIFLFGFFCQSEDLFWHFIDLISETPDLNIYVFEKELDEDFILHFPSILSCLKQLPYSSLLMYCINIHGFGLMYVSCGVNYNVNLIGTHGQTFQLYKRSFELTAKCSFCVIGSLYVYCVRIEHYPKATPLEFYAKRGCIQVLV